MNTQSAAWVCSGTWDIYRAAELAQQLREGWTTAVHQHTLPLDMSAVDEIDSSGVQLLLSLQRTAQAHAVALQLTAVSPAVEDVLQRMGLAHWCPFAPATTGVATAALADTATVSQHLAGAPHAV